MTVCKEWTLTADKYFTGLCTMTLTALTGNDTKQCAVCVDPIGITVTHGTYDVPDASGTWEVPAGIHEITVKLNGGGGGGGGGQVAGGGTGGSGGGGGGYCEVVLAVSPGDLITYVRGTGGNAGTGANPGTNGTAGTASSIMGGTYIANGGGAGLYASAATVSGGTASGGDINTTGGTGGGNSSNVGGSGGSSPNGGASVTGTSPNGTPLNGNDPGGGGAGGAGGVNGTNGGHGANGRVRFIW